MHIHWLIFSLNDLIWYYGWLCNWRCLRVVVIFHLTIANFLEWYHSQCFLTFQHYFIIECTFNRPYWGFFWILLRLLSWGCLHVCIYEVKNIMHDVMTYVKSCDFDIAKDWWGINKLSLCYGADHTLTICEIYMFSCTLSLIYYVYCVCISNLCWHNLTQILIL